MQLFFNNRSDFIIFFKALVSNMIIVCILALMSWCGEKWFMSSLNNFALIWGLWANRASCSPSVKLASRLTSWDLKIRKENLFLLKKKEISVHFMDQIMSDLKHFEREGGGKKSGNYSRRFWTSGTWIMTSLDWCLPEKQSINQIRSFYILIYLTQYNKYSCIAAGLLYNLVYYLVCIKRCF